MNEGSRHFKRRFPVYMRAPTCGTLYPLDCHQGQAPIRAHAWDMIMIAAHPHPSKLGQDCFRCTQRSQRLYHSSSKHYISSTFANIQIEAEEGGYWLRFLKTKILLLLYDFLFNWNNRILLFNLIWYAEPIYLPSCTNVIIYKKHHISW